MSVNVLGLEVETIGYSGALACIDSWVAKRESRYVCAANVHMVMEAHDSPSFAAVVNGADLAVPDGMPLVWWAHAKGERAASRVRGPELMLRVCAQASAKGWPIGLYGGDSQTLKQLQDRLLEKWPALVIAYAYSPPFRPLDQKEQQAIVDDIAKAGVSVLFVALGCPKQETWMARHKGRIGSVMIGVGAAFDFHSKTVAEAPAWMQKSGLEWLHRLATEPGRLWKRYFWHNTRFVLLAGRQFIKDRIVGEST